MVALLFPVSLILVVVASALDVERNTVPPPPAVPAPAVFIPADDVLTTVLTRAPHHTETLLGRLQVPINLIFVGTQGEIENAFRASGWITATKQGFPALERAVSASFGDNRIRLDL